MSINKIENISKQELKKIENLVGEAFVTNNLFYNWGTIEQRKSKVMKYMKLYVDYVYESGGLYSNEEKTGFVGIIDSRNAPILPQIKMLIKMMFSIKISDIKKFLNFANQIKDSNKKYAQGPHLDILMVCVDKKEQGKGIATQLVEFAKMKSDELKLPLLFDTDMESYADMYQYFGCKLYNQITADNGITRYSLVYSKELKNI